MEQRGHRVSRKKTGYMVFNDAGDRDIKVPDYVLQKVDSFKYLSLTVRVDGELENEIEKGIQAGWMN